ncbi:MAG: polymer-forming cytoskeletal protein [Catonella sp.]|jgi:cytoskeletal protein CcmA (bactofilin family)|nr:polymer-forming cytoskeletal protein [Catonella sp.]MDY6356736.1 polymer-forming cytoskeletal protein [Catonella sp.]
MSFLKDLAEDIGTAAGELADDAVGVAADENEEKVDEEVSAKKKAAEEVNVEEETEAVPASDDLAGFDLSEEDDSVDTDMLGKIMEEEAAAKEAEIAAKETGPEVAEASLPEGATAPIVSGSEEPAPVFDENSVDSGKSTVIAKGTTINGSIVSDGSLEVYGTVKGDINCLGKLSIAGSVIGNSTASEVYINTDRLDGGITSKGSVKIGVGTVVIGDITASSLVIAGAVKGEIDVNGPVVVDSTAVVKGNINSKGIQVNNGAVIDGFCALPYAAVDIDSFFDEAGNGDRK